MKELERAVGIEATPSKKGSWKSSVPSLGGCTMLLQREVRGEKVARTRRSKQGEVTEWRRDERGDVIAGERLETG